jgi:hypothetical protein
MTGSSQMLPELSAKQLELLKRVVPSISRVGGLWKSTSRILTIPQSVLLQADQVTE